MQTKQPNSWYKQYQQGSQGHPRNMNENLQGSPVPQNTFQGHEQEKRYSNGNQSQISTSQAQVSSILIVDSSSGLSWIYFKLISKILSIYIYRIRSDTTAICKTTAWAIGIDPVGGLRSMSAGYVASEVRLSSIGTGGWSTSDVNVAGAVVGVIEKSDTAKGSFLTLVTTSFWSEAHTEISQ